MTTLQRVSWIGADHLLYHKWFASINAANDYVNELHTLGAESVDFEDVMVPQDLVGDLVHFLNTTPNAPRMKGDDMAIRPTILADDEEKLGSLLWGGPLNPERLAEQTRRRLDGLTVTAGTWAPLPEADPNGLDANAPGAKLDAGKVLPWLCISGFSRAIKKVAEVTTVGAKKYSPNGWMQVDDGEARYMEAFGRHLLELGRGERYDADTGAMHKAQMIWNLLASLELELKGAETDAVSGIGSDK